jgi:1-deoxy-D-xylulose-5-phosphate reductoisomerase
VAGSPQLNRIVVLGATGSIGSQTLNVARQLGLEVVGVAAQRPSASLQAIAGSHPDASIAVAGGTDAERSAFSREVGGPVSFGDEAVAELAASPDVIVVNGIVGVAGLGPSVAALQAGNRLALANKESLVAGGDVVLAAEAEGNGELIPVDSEHSALWQCMVGEDRGNVRRLILTASGGPFRGRTAESLAAVTVDEALDHPTWDMGPRITVDSATLMNKAFEVIEAHFLFGMSYDAIEVVVHPQSVVHSLVEYVDGSVTAELGDPDMRGPIQYAITYPARREAQSVGFDLTGRHLTFEAPDITSFPCLALGYRAGREGGSAPAVLNAADEVSVGAFLQGDLSFHAIANVVAATLDAVPVVPLTSVDAVWAADEAARDAAADAVRRLGVRGD